MTRDNDPLSKVADPGEIMPWWQIALGWAAIFALMLAASFALAALVRWTLVLFDAIPFPGDRL